MFRRSSNSTENKGPISLEWIDFCFLKNGEKHRTDKYYCMNEMNPTLVVRRGLPFCFHLKFNREFEKDKDHVSFMFKLAGNNQQFNTFNSIKYDLELINIVYKMDCVKTLSKCCRIMILGYT